MRHDTECCENNFKDRGTVLDSTDPSEFGNGFLSNQFAEKGLSAEFYLQGVTDQDLCESVVDLVWSRRDASGIPATYDSLRDLAYSPAVLVFEQGTQNLVAVTMLGDKIYLDVETCSTGKRNIVVVEVAKTNKMTTAPSGIGPLLWQAALIAAKKMGADAVFNYNLLTNWPTMSKYGKPMMHHIVGYFDQDMIGDSRSLQSSRLQQNDYMAVVFITPVLTVEHVELLAWTWSMRQNILEKHPFREQPPNFAELMSLVKADPEIRDPTPTAQKISACLGIQIEIEPPVAEVPSARTINAPPPLSSWERAKSYDVQPNINTQVYIERAMTYPVRTVSLMRLSKKYSWLPEQTKSVHVGGLIDGESPHESSGYST